MDITFILSAIIFTLLAVVVAASVFNRSSPSADVARGCFGHTGKAKAGGLSRDKSAPKHNGHISDNKKTTAVDDWTEVCGSTHDHWDVVQSVLSEESLSNPSPAEPETTAECTTTSSQASSSRDTTVECTTLSRDTTEECTPTSSHTSSSRDTTEECTPTSSHASSSRDTTEECTPASSHATSSRDATEECTPTSSHATSSRDTTEECTPASSHATSSRDMSFHSSSEASSSRSVIGLSEKELLKCAFSHPQTEDATGSNDEEVDADGMPLKYVPGMLRTSQMETMMSRDELQEEQRVQREQLAAIFQLLKDNRQTFGEVSEGDMEEQLKLYSV